MIKTDFIEKVINIMQNNELSEVTLEDEEQSLYIKTNVQPPVIQAKNEQETIKSEEEKSAAKSERKVIPVVSDMIGLYFSKPSPDKMPFVRVGDRVKPGQQLCIIETIKLMNNVVSEVSGIVKEICIEDGKPVEYGQTIMYIEQD